jgi:tetratricopeptide (TPR) repeat protein
MPELLQDVFAALLAGNKAETRLVLADQLQERLPPLLGFDFDCDLVLRNVLAEVQQVSPASLAMPERFSRALAKRLGAHDADADADTADADTDDTDTDTDDTDDDNVAATNWGNVAAVRAAIAGKRWKALRLGLDENRAAHFKTLVALRPAELRAFAKSGYGPATRVANAGVFPLSRGDFKTALKLFDAAIEGPLDSGAAANPLFAVQDDNNHLGVDAARARRYLERCLPAGDRNPTVFLNGAFVCMELGEPDLALELLARAKKLGIKVKAHRNERLFVPLHARAEFKKLMR